MTTALLLCIAVGTAVADKLTGGNDGGHCSVGRRLVAGLGPTLGNNGWMTGIIAPMVVLVVLSCKRRTKPLTYPTILQ